MELPDSAANFILDSLANFICLVWQSMWVDNRRIYALISFWTLHITVHSLQNIILGIDKTYMPKYELGMVKELKSKLKL